MNKTLRTLYFIIISILILSLSGCGGSDDDNSPAKNRLMVLTSPVFKLGESYKLYRGDKVGILSLDAMYYVAPIHDETGDDASITLNLEFRDELSEDLPFVITTEDIDSAVVFAYNPEGRLSFDTTTRYGDVTRFGGGTQQLKYNGLHVAGTSIPITPSAIDIDQSDVRIIALSGDSLTVSGQAIPEYPFVWHADPNHRNEYFTLEDEELTEDDMLELISPVSGVYIAHDVRYTPSTISFTGTARKDDDIEYVAYYSNTVASQAANELGAGFEGPYIFATLPVGNPRGADPDARNTDIDAFATMTHSASEAYQNPVLHIVEGGVYRLTGNWNGQVWVEVGDDEDVALILDDLNVTCTVAPAIVIRSARECGPVSDIVSFDVGRKMLGDDELAHAGAMVVIADGSVNNIKGANVYRLLKADKKSSATKIDGTDISDQKKLYKMDGAMYSFVSIAIGAENNRGGGRLNITSTTYEGLCSELHMLIDSGTIRVTAEDDGINVNEDDTSVFTMNGGSLTVTSKYGDGIDSNGYIVINNGTLDITAAQDSNELNARADGPMDADLGVYMSDTVTYTHQAYSNNSGGEEPTDGRGDIVDEPVGRRPVTIRNESGQVVMSINYDSPVKDDSTIETTIPGSSELFRIRRRVNSFAGITYKESD